MRVWLAIPEAMRLYSRMQRIIGPFTYEDQDFKSVFAHAKRLEGKTLREIAAMTGGKFFRVADTDTIESAFKAIDRAQKIEFQAKSYLLATELFWWLAAPGLLALAAAAVLARPPQRKEAFA